jgi:acyl-CoA synthetase (AMP-forming)/AMP-acid ligase II/acyl carrier protein
MSPSPSTTEGFSSFVERLEERAAERPDQIAFSFLRDGEDEAESLTYGALIERVRAVAARLQAEGAAGKPVLLLYPSGLEFVTAFLGCLWSGAIAVPTYPPRSSRSLPRLEAILADARPALALTPRAALPRLAAWSSRLAGALSPRYLASDDLPAGLAAGWRAPESGPQTLAFLQYTSGSTSLPKGVMVTHGNLLANEEMIRRSFGQSAGSIVVSWLPLYHDMGLVGGVLQPLYVGGRAVLLSPVSFLQRPLRWLAAISRYRATTSGGPNFAYDLCARRIAESERAQLDLSSWEVAFNGAEPIRAETLARFSEAFHGAGFRPRSFLPCYGLAEATLLVAGGAPEAAPVVAELDAAALERGRARFSEPKEEPTKSWRLVGCGRPAGGLTVVIADPATGERCAPDRIGEIWVAGPGVAAGYWGRPQATAETFAARLAGEPAAGPFLRTGDLGFLARGELWIAGRRKDLIILRGRNLYPQDVERTAELVHPALRPGCGAAFAIERDGEERLVVVWELDRRHAGEDAGALAEAVRRAVGEEFEVAVEEVLLVAPGCVPKTSSGKIQRQACRAAYLAVSWKPLGRSVPRDETAADDDFVAPPDRMRLAALPPGERRAALLALLRRETARAARVSAGEISSAATLAATGIDSLAAVELQGRLEEQLQLAVSLDDLLGAESLEALALQWATRLGDTGRHGGEEIDTGGEPGGEVALSAGQRALWFLHRLAPESAAYHLAAAVRLAPPLDAAALARAVAALCRRHPLLRTTFGARDGEPWQRVHPRLEGAWSEVAAEGWSEGELALGLEREAGRPFDLAAAPPLRVTLFARGASGAVLLFVVHHLVADFWSLALAARELGALYDAETEAWSAALPPLVHEYADFVRWQRRHLASPAGDRLWAYWRQRLAGAPFVLDLPTDRPRPPLQTDRGAVAVEPIDAAAAVALRALARRNGATLFATALAAFAALLHRLTGQADLVVGTAAAGRTSPAWSGIFGYFVNPVPLRIPVAGAQPLTEIVARARDCTSGALTHQDFPFPLLTERLQPERDPSRTPIFQVMFLLQRSPLPGLEPLAALAVGWPGVPLALGGLRGESLPWVERTAQLDLTLSLAETGGSLLAALRFNRDLFDATTARRLLGQYRALLAAASDPSERDEQPIGELPLLTPAESHQLRLEWNDTGSLPASVGLFTLLAAQAARTPAAVAVACGDRWLTYGELAGRARRLAGRARWASRRRAGWESWSTARPRWSSRSSASSPRAERTCPSSPPTRGRASPG